MFGRGRLSAKPVCRVQARFRHCLSALLTVCFVLFAAAASAHVSEQGFVLLLPTNIYISSGVVVVLLSVLVLAIVPENKARQLFASRRLVPIADPAALQVTASLISTVILAVLLLRGWYGPRDPLSNPLTLGIWTVWWLALLVLQGMIGNLWHWVNPWTGLYALLGRWAKPRYALPEWVGCWGGCLLFLLFMVFALADPAPDDPARLAQFAALYWLGTFAGMLLFGQQAWLTRVEGFTLLMQAYSRMSVFGLRQGRLHVGLPAWKVLSTPVSSVSLAVFYLLLLGSGSFDGLNETFWWLARIGVNPLAFPGRSAIVGETITGLLAFNALLICAFALCVRAGSRLARLSPATVGSAAEVSAGRLFVRLSVALLPIALAYHFSHYLTSFLVNGQYVLVALTDPFSTGADWLKLGEHFVSTGFLNSHHSIEKIWLTQAAVVVAGHVISVLLAHALAVELYGEKRKAVLSQIPLAMFMILYTFIGLWLLASPRGA